MFCNGRLPAAMEFGQPGRGSKRHIPWPSVRPVPGTVTNEPNADPCVCVRLTRLPCVSAAEIWLVHLNGSGTICVPGSTCSTPRRTVSRSSCSIGAVHWLVSGTPVNAGSPSMVSFFIQPAFIASI